MKRTNEKTKEGEEAKEGLQKELKEERDEKLWRKGLESAEAEKRLKKYGENRIFVLREPSFFDFISTMLDQFHLPTILFLFSIILFSYIDLRSSIIAFVLILGIGIINAFRDFNVKKSIAKLSEPYPGYTTVIRDGLRKGYQPLRLYPAILFY